MARAVGCYRQTQGQRRDGQRPSGVEACSGPTDPRPGCPGWKPGVPIPTSAGVGAGAVPSAPKTKKSTNTTKKPPPPPGVAATSPRPTGGCATWCSPRKPEHCALGGCVGCAVCATSKSGGSAMPAVQSSAAATASSTQGGGTPAQPTVSAADALAATASAGGAAQIILPAAAPTGGGGGSVVAWASVMAGGVVVLLLAVALAVVCQPSLIDRLPSAGLRAALTTLANLGRRGAGKGAYAVAGANGEGVGVAAAG